MNMNEIVIPLVSKLAWDLFFDSDSSEDSEEDYMNSRRNVFKNVGFWEDTIPLFDDQQFKEHFRLSPGSFEELLRGLHIISSQRTDVKPGRPPLHFEKQVLITLWYLANTECFRSVADRFGVSIRACWNTVHSICNEILRLNRETKIISWPNEGKAKITADYYQIKTKFPGVIGCIDGTHIAIPAPKVHPEAYINRKNYHSVLLQAVCNERMIFTDCYTGEAGSIHDSCMFRRSHLFKRISDGSLTISPDKHILGDQGYGLKPYLLVAFKDNGQLSEAQKNYNQVLSSIRVVIERAFGLLKNRFRRLYGLQTRKPESIPLIIMTACILHNICLEQGDYIDDNILLDDDVNIEASHQQYEPQAQTKRNEIALQLSL